ncbi:MAG: tetratricopeptide repeat protein [Bacteroidota bacterium]
MKSRLPQLLVILCILCSQLISASGITRTDSLDSVLSNLKNPKDKVDAILKFLEKPENQYMEDTIAIELANRANAIAKQTNYAKGEVNSMIKLGNNYVRSNNYKKAMEFAQKSKEMAEDLNFDLELGNSLILIGVIYSELGNFDYSSQYYFRGLKIFEKIDDNEGIARSLGNIGMGFFDQQDYKKAFEYFNKSLILAQAINNEILIKKQYNNISNIYGGEEKYDSAILFLRKAQAINIKLGDKLGQGINIMNIGYVQMNEGKYKEAFQSFQQSLDFATALDNHLHMAECYVNFGFCNYSVNRISESIDFFNKAIKEGQRNGYYRIIASAAKMLDQIYKEKKDTLNAYKYLMLEKLAADSLFASKKQILISKFELQYLYEKKEFDRQQTQQAKSKIMLIIILSLVSGLVILGLVFSRHRLKSKFVVLEKEKIELEKNKIESELVIKDRELTVNLISLIKKNEIFSGFSSKLLQLERNAKGLEAKEVITLMSHELRNSTDDKMLSEFSLRFQEIHAGFYEKLLNIYPDLSQNELKLCAFLRLNMSTKDISELTGQQLASIDQARYRLRKKIGLSNSEANLVTFLSQV